MPWSIGLLLAVSIGVVNASGQNYTCPSCSEDLEFVKMMRINEVKNTILEKLRLSRVPNITSADLEHLPPIDQLISDFGLSADMYSDQPSEPLGENTYYEEDKFHVNVEQAALFPDTGELNFSSICITSPLRVHSKCGYNLENRTQSSQLDPA